MLRITVLLAAVLASSATMASSIEFIHGTPQGAGSIVAATCSTCKPSEQQSSSQPSLAYVVPSLPAEEVQSTEVKDLAGKREILRTERWLGGSPVLHVTRAPPMMQAFLPAALGIDGLDPAMTAAVDLPVAPPTEQNGLTSIMSLTLRP